jgi:hypothetical protein
MDTIKLQLQTELSRKQKELDYYTQLFNIQHDIEYTQSEIEITKSRLNITTMNNQQPTPTNVKSDAKQAILEIINTKLDNILEKLKTLENEQKGPYNKDNNNIEYR